MHLNKERNCERKRTIGKLDDYIHFYELRSEL